MCVILLLPSCFAMTISVSFRLGELERIIPVRALPSYCYNENVIIENHDFKYFTDLVIYNGRDAGRFPNFMAVNDSLVMAYNNTVVVSVVYKPKTKSIGGMLTYTIGNVAAVFTYNKEPGIYHIFPRSDGFVGGKYYDFGVEYSGSLEYVIGKVACSHDDYYRCELKSANIKTFVHG
jgi:hypothetical protein